jgi:hypothetical protein
MNKLRVNPCLPWIVGNVFLNLPKRPGVAHDVIVALVLPDAARAPEQLVDFMSRKGLPRMQNLIQRPSFFGGNHRVDVVGHHDPRAKGVALPVEMPQSTGDDCTDAFIAKQTGPSPGVEPVLNALGKKAVVILLVSNAVRFGMVPDPCFALRFQRRQLLRR